MNLGGSKIGWNDILFTPDGHRLVVTAEIDRIIRVYDPLDPDQPTHLLRGHEGVIFGQTVSPATVTGS